MPVLGLLHKVGSLVASSKVGGGGSKETRTCNNGICPYFPYLIDLHSKDLPLIEEHIRHFWISYLNGGNIRDMVLEAFLSLQKCLVAPESTSHVLSGRPLSS